MKYFTKQWYLRNQRCDLHFGLHTTKKAEIFSEEYYQKVYKKELKKFLKLYKEISEHTADDVFPLDAWDSFAVVGDKGDFVDATEFYSPDEYEELRGHMRLRQQEYHDNFVPKTYDESELTQRFEQMQQARIEEFQNNLPKDILNEIADIRVLALAHVSKENRAQIRSFCHEQEKQVKRTLRRYQRYYKGISDKIPENIRENFCFHDCKVTLLTMTDSKLIIELDSSGGFTNCTRVLFIDAVLLEDEGVAESYWINDEIYLIDKGYEFHAALYGTDGAMKYLTIQAKDVKFVLGRDKYK